MSPRAFPPSFGGPSPRSRCTVPWCVPAGTRSRLLPCSVGTSTSAPRIASGIVSGTSTSTLSPLRRKTGLSLTCVTTNRSPDGPLFGPGPPLPASRTREPSRTPGGMLTLYRFVVRTTPSPRHVGHGSSITVPAPPQRVHGCEIENRPWPCDSSPRPWQRGQTFGDVPGFAPVPWQVVHRDGDGTASGTWVPVIASSKEIVTSASRSAPFSGRVRAPAGPAVPPARLNRFERMSPNPPAASKPPKPPWPAVPAPVLGPPPRPPEPKKIPPRSYCLRLSGSPTMS